MEVEESDLENGSVSDSSSCSPLLNNRSDRNTDHLKANSPVLNNAIVDHTEDTLLPELERKLMAQAINDEESKEEKANCVEQGSFKFRLDGFHTRSGSDVSCNVTELASTNNSRDHVDSLSSSSVTTSLDDDSDQDSGGAIQVSVPDALFDKKIAKLGGKKVVIGSVESLHSTRSRNDSSSTAQNHRHILELFGDNLSTEEMVVNMAKMKLKYNFMNPCQKYRAKGTKPVKLLVQILKIIFVTIQLSMFSKYQFDYRLFIDGNCQSFDNLFLYNWQSSFNDPVQRVPNPYAIFHIDDFYANINYTVTSYFTLNHKALGNFSYPPLSASKSETTEIKNEKSGGKLDHVFDINRKIPPIRLCKTFYNYTLRKDDPKDIALNSQSSRECVWVHYNDTVRGQFNFEKWSTEANFIPYWSDLIDFKVSFALINQHVGSQLTYFKPVCDLFKISIVYDNSRHTGKLAITRTYEVSDTECFRPTYEYSDAGLLYMVLNTLMDCFIILLALLCAFLCFRSIQSNLYLRNVTRGLWLKKFGKPLSRVDEKKFVQNWYFVLIFGDFSLILGTICKILVTYRVMLNYTICAVLLGCATMTVWIGVLKYLNYFHTYNALLLTLRYSMPNVLRFLVCCLFVYFGFAMAGWAVFGPFHYKFRSFVSTMETMYSLINGDDMFATFSEMRDDNALVYWFNQIWLYVFIGLFIYCVLSLFIGIITETYEHIRLARDNNGTGQELTEMEKFFNDISEDPQTTSYHYLRPSDKFICLCCMRSEFDLMSDPSCIIRGPTN